MTSPIFLLFLLVSCAVIEAQDDSPPVYADPSICAAGDGLYSYPGNYSLFIQCSRSIPYIKNCPAGVVFNPATQDCDWPNKVPGCANRCNEADALQYPNPDDCHKFKQCANGILVDKVCPGNQVFNAQQLMCADPVDGDCDS